MTYIAFLFVILVASVVFFFARSLGSAISFEKIFERTGIVIVFIPIVVQILIIWGLLTFLILICSDWILERLGLLDRVTSLPIWQSMPRWLWLLLATIVVALIGNAVILLLQLFRRPSEKS